MKIAIQVPELTDATNEAVYQSPKLKTENLNWASLCKKKFPKLMFDVLFPHAFCGVELHHWRCNTCPE
jgi:hypothetical protein